MIKFDLNNFSSAQVTRDYRSRNEKVISALADRMTSLMQKFAEKVRVEKLSGQVLNPVSGKLADSIQPEPTEVTGDKIVGRVAWAEGEAWYGRVHEFGGTRTYAINPIQSASAYRRGKALGRKALRFEIGGKEIFAAYVFHPPLPVRSFMRSSFTEMHREIVLSLQETASTAARKRK